MKITEAIALAQKWHKGQKYGNEDYFGGHLFKVLRLVQEKYAGDEVMEVVAVLHDILEDTACPESEVAKFGSEVLEAVKLLTKKKEDSRKVYLRNLLGNRVAREVKWCDASANLQASVDSRDARRIAKYADTLTIILSAEKEFYKEPVLNSITDGLTSVSSVFDEVRGRFLDRPDLDIIDRVIKKIEERRCAYSPTVMYTLFGLSIDAVVEEYLKTRSIFLWTIEKRQLREQLSARYVSQIGMLYELRFGVKRPDWVVEAKHVPMLIKLLKEFRNLCLKSG